MLRIVTPWAAATLETLKAAALTGEPRMILPGTPRLVE